MIGNCRSASVDEQNTSFFIVEAESFLRGVYKAEFFFSSFPLADFQKSTATHPP